MCLFAKGGKANEDKALSILYPIRDRYNSVKAAFMIATYERTGGGTFEKRDENKINEAIDAYLKVLALIRSDPYYPFPNPHIPISNSNGFNDIYEAGSQMELRSAYFVTLLYSNKFNYGVTGSHNLRLLSSPNYEGERNLKTYPDYAPYTIDSLNQLARYAEEYLGIKPKDHFNPQKYRQYREVWQIYKNRTEEVLPLEEQRLVLLSIEDCIGRPECPKNRVEDLIPQEEILALLSTESLALLSLESCGDNLLDCYHNGILNEMKLIFKRYGTKIRTIFGETLASK